MAGTGSGEIDIELSRHHLRLTWPARIAAGCPSSKARPCEPWNGARSRASPCQSHHEPAGRLSGAAKAECPGREGPAQPRTCSAVQSCPMKKKQGGAKYPLDGLWLVAALARRGASGVLDVRALPGRCAESVSRPRSIRKSGHASGSPKADRDGRRRRFAAS